jgi:hypothetical protein
VSCSAFALFVRMDEDYRLKFSEMYIITNPACVAGGPLCDFQVDRFQ